MDYLSYVNTKMGAESTPRFSRGNTLPLTQLPFGMVAFCPQTEIIKGRETWFYSPSAPYTEGIRLTHQPSPWIGDYGTLLFTPQSDVISNTYSGAWSSYDPKSAINAPDYIKMKLNRPCCTVELSPTERTAIMKLSFDTEQKKALSIFGVHGNTSFELDKKKSILYVESDYFEKGDAHGFKMHVAIKITSLVRSESYGAENCFHLALKDKKATARIGISYISREMALNNLELENDGKSLVKIRQEAKRAWNARLGKIEIEPYTKKQKQIFYSCMYRAFLYPHKAYEIKKDGQSVYFSPFDGKIKQGVRYGGHGAWDTYRTNFPLYALIARDDYEAILKSYLNDYKSSGYLPRWNSLGEVGCMPSTLVDAIIAHAVACKIGTPELHNELLDAMIHHARNESADPRYGRNGLAKYLEYGYVPCDFERECVNLTLDFAYGDWCISQVARHLGRNDIASEFEKRSEWYKSIFDTESGFFRAKDKNGVFKADFDPTMWGNGYTESSAYQVTFGVPHAIDKIAELLGGTECAIKKIDEIFNTPPKYRVHGYGGEIHEMSEMALSNLGQCAISNQPSFSIPFLYAHFGKKEMSDRVIKEICDKYFTLDSYPGDEDNGSMSAWYIFATIGKFPLCPGKNELTETTPLVKSYKIN